MGDEGRLGQVVRNLLDNALRYTPGGGRVTVTLQSEPEHARASDGVALRIRDTGPGIAPHERERIFERFHRADSGRSERGRRVGSGLGLAICQAIVRAHGGQIRVEDGAPEAVGDATSGAEVVVTLPGLANGAG